MLEVASSSSFSPSSPVEVPQQALHFALESNRGASLRSGPSQKCKLDSERTGLRPSPPPPQSSEMSALRGRFPPHKVGGTATGSQSRVSFLLPIPTRGWGYGNGGQSRVSFLTRGLRPNPPTSPTTESATAGKLRVRFLDKASSGR